MDKLQLDLEEIQIIVVQSLNRRIDDIDYSEIYTRIEDTDNFALKYVSEGLCEYCGENNAIFDEETNEWVPKEKHECSGKYQEIELVDILKYISENYVNVEDVLIYINDELVKDFDSIISLDIDLED